MDKITFSVLITTAYSKESAKWNEPSTMKQVFCVNGLLEPFHLTRENRLMLLAYLFDRSFNTSKELTKGEASALIELGYDDVSTKARSEAFHAFIEQSLKELTQW